jgi:hypothetical protein
VTRADELAELRGITEDREAGSEIAGDNDAA